MASCWLTGWFEAGFVQLGWRLRRLGHDTVALRLPVPHEFSKEREDDRWQRQ